MVRSSSILAALHFGLFLAAAVGSWSPLPLHHFKAGPPGVGATSGSQRFGHEEHNVLQDGSSVHLRWEVDAEPESLLALDWEHRNGIALVECQRDHLVLSVPRAHAPRVAHWRLVTASGRFHGCGHLASRDLYHRVLHVAARGQTGEAEAITLATEELSSPSELFPHCSFALALRPPANVVPNPASQHARRLRQSSVSMSSSGSGSGEEKPMDVLDKAIEGLTPASHYNWTWNFSFAPKMPPSIHWNMQLPTGAKGFLKSDTSTLEASLGMALNFTSQKDGEGAAPTAHFVGQLDFDLDLDTELSAALDFEDEAESTEMPPISLKDLLPLPMPLANLKFFLGPVPVTLKASFDSMTLKVRHSGVFEGSFNAAVKTRLSVSVAAEFDTLTGLKTNFTAVARDTKFVPPVFLISAQDFELDLALEANASLKPFFNASVRPEISMFVSPMDAPTAPPTLPPALPTLPPVMPTLPPVVLPTLAPVMPTDLPTLPPDPSDCQSRDLVLKVNANVDATTSVVSPLHLFSDSEMGKLADILPPMACPAGACTGTKPGCKKPPMQPISIKKITVKISRSMTAEHIGSELSDEVAFALALLPSAVEVVTGVLGNRTSTKLVEQDIEQLLEAEAGNVIQGLEGDLEAVEKAGLHEADNGLTKGAQEAEALMQSRDRRLAGAAGSEEFDTFLIQLKDSPHFEITDELLASLAREGAFRIRDGREREMGAIRVNSIQLLKTQGLREEQQLWDKAAMPAARAASGGMSSRVGHAALLAAVALVGLGAMPKLWRRCLQKAALPAEPME